MQVVSLVSTTIYRTTHAIFDVIYKKINFYLNSKIHLRNERITKKRIKNMYLQLKRNYLFVRWLAFQYTRSVYNNTLWYISTDDACLSWNFQL